MASDPNFVPLGAVMALHVGLDPEAGEPDEMIRDMMTFRATRLLMRLPSFVDIRLLDQVMADDIGRWKTAKDSGDVGTAQDATLELLAAGLLIKAGGDGGLLAGYRWRLVPRARVDKGAFAIEALEANRRVERWL